MTLTPSGRAAVCCAGLLVALSSLPLAAAEPPAGQAQIDALQRELDALKQQLGELAQQNRELKEREQQLESRLSQQQAAPAAPAAAAAAPSVAAPVPAGAAPAAAVATAVPAPPLPAPVPSAGSPAALPGGSGAPPAASGLPSALENLRLWGYGEVYYSYPLRDSRNAQADLARAVFGIGYQLDPVTEFNSEYEVEHAVTSATDPGEFEVEQFYIDRQLNEHLAARAGLMLMPFGMINEHHEPTEFYGMQRNFVETLIIPSTWREGGVSLRGDAPAGFGWNVGVTTGFDLSKWNFAPEFPPYHTPLDLEDSDIAPLQASHQELALANGHDLSQYVALSYYGTPGFNAGAAIFTGNAVKVPAPPNSIIPGGERVTLWEGHARWTPGKFDLSALYARGAISNVALANAANPGSPNPIPSSFYGWFLQAGYEAWSRGEYRLVPFVRWEYYNMGASYQGTSGPAIPQGMVPLSSNPGDYGYWPVNEDRVWTLGANFYLNPHLVLKADYQHFDLNTDFTRVDLGLGLAF